MKIFKLLVLSLGLMALVSCGGGSGSDSAPGTTPAGSDTSIVVKTTVDLTDAVAGSVFDGSRSARATAITVTLTLADGTEYEMSSNGNGEYSCTVEDYSDGTVGYVEAHAGDLVLKNLFDSLTNESGEASIGATDPESTMFVDIVQAYVGALQANGNSASAEELLAGFAGATLDIDVTSFRESIEDDDAYDSLRQTYSAALTVQNAENGVSVSNVLATALQSSEVYEQIQTGGILVPGSSSDAETAAEMIEIVFNAYTSGDVSGVAEILGSLFLNEGYDTAAFLADLQQEVTEMTQAGVTVNVLSATPKAVKVNDETYKVYIVSHLQVVDPSGTVIEEEKSDDTKHFLYKTIPMFAKYNDSTWSLIGNRKKADFWLSQGFYNVNGTFEYRVWADVEETDLYPISHVYLDADFFSNEVELFVNSNDDSNEYHFFASQSTQEYYSGGVSYPASWVGTICDDRAVKLYAVYADGTQDAVNVTLPTCPTAAELDDMMPAISSFDELADGSYRIEFVVPQNSKVANIRFEIYNTNGNLVFEGDNLPFDTTHIDIPASDIASGTYNVSIKVEDLYGRDFGDSITHTIQ